MVEKSIYIEHIDLLKSIYGDIDLLNFSDFSKIDFLMKNRYPGMEYG